MRIDFAEIKSISIIDFLARLGIRPVRKYTAFALYNAPYRKDIHPSFKVSIAKNRWYDLANCKSGDILDLAMIMYNTSSVLDAAQRIVGLDSRIVKQTHSRVSLKSEDAKGTFSDIKSGPITNPLLVSYIATRGIDWEIAQKYCEELYYRVRGRSYFAIGFKNIRGGYEIRNPRVKLCIGIKDVTLLRRKEGNKDCILFEGFMDFLSYLTLGKRGEFATIPDTVDFMVLNSVSNLLKAIPWLMQYQIVSCCLDNDDAGRNAVNTLREVHKGVYDVSNTYGGYKDLNDYLIKKPYHP
jgi:hypothetical protein